ncbi:hypothetical protein MVEN_02487500 [Mycena venus]|uniref:Uncharacterized protein n=1 Tax=Mycena venus TaxID=2733690 RepID=A0A8H6WXW7_9AGAR|nr:hypothetical protein MVEN_02487500 [Mycena venus]
MASTIIPSTPVSSHKSYQGLGRSYIHKPMNSSPLAPSGSSPGSSPVAAVQARRLSQYKARSSSGSVASSSRSSTATARPVAYGAGAQLGDVGDDSQTAFLRTRLKLRCIERATKARERAVQKKRVMLSSSDDMDMDDDDNEDDFAFDELYTRIMRNTARKMHHAYMYSYDREVGSDPPDEPQNWESELAAQAESDKAAEDLEDDAELLTYLREQEEEAAFADFADIPADDLFNWNDIDEDLLSGAGQPDHDEMDLS